MSQELDDLNQAIQNLQAKDELVLESTTSLVQQIADLKAAIAANDPAAIEAAAKLINTEIDRLSAAVIPPPADPSSQTSE